jgi:DNA-binding HxlR family transcriptional regulator
VAGGSVGVRAFSILEKPLNITVLRAHAAGRPTRLFEVQRTVDWVPATTLRATVANMCRTGALVRAETRKPGGSAATCLTASGRELLQVGDAVAAWLAICPQGPIPPAGERARLALKALAGGWSTQLIRIVAEQPASHRELSRLLPAVSYPVLERRLAWMQRVGQIERVERAGRDAAYRVLPWLRLAVAPLSVSGRWEHRRLGEDGAELSEVEVEASLLLALPLIGAIEAPDTTYTLAVTLPGTSSDGRSVRLAGVTVEVVKGRIRSCVPGVGAAPSTWAIGAPEAWEEAVIDGRATGLRLGGKAPSGGARLVAAIHCLLFEPA